MNVIAIVSAAGALTFLTMGVTRQAGLEGRLATMEEAASRSRTSLQGVGQIEALQARIDALTDQLTTEPSGTDAAEIVADLSDEVSLLQAELTEAKAALAKQAAELATVEALARKADRIDEVQAGVETRWGGFTEALEAQAVLVEATRHELDGVRAQISESGDTTFASGDAPSRGDAWTDMVGPTVQLAGDATVGSGVILKSQPIAGTDGDHQTLLLTSWHVVRDIRADSVDEDAPIPVMLRDAFGNKRNLTATLVAYDAPLDSALLRVDSTEAFPVGAALPTRERLKNARVFDSIVAVGCPLGNDPIPTRGHLSDLYHTVSSERFWMISAPTYIGNSGGGIYSGDSHELLGIFSKIYTHGAIRPTVIPHMGLVTPLEEFYDWIDGSQIAEVVESGGQANILLR